MVFKQFMSLLSSLKLLAGPTRTGTTVNDVWSCPAAELGQGLILPWFRNILKLFFKLDFEIELLRKGPGEQHAFIFSVPK